MQRLLIAVLTLAWLLCGAVARVDAERIFITDGLSITNFDSATPNAISPLRRYTGLQPGERIVAIDFRPADNQLYGITGGPGAARIYTINGETGTATFVSTVNAPLTSNIIGIDFNPVTDRLRVVGVGGQNLLINVDTGGVAVDAPLAYAAGDVNAGRAARVGAIAYSNNFANAASTTLFGIDTNLGVLVTQNPPNEGILNTVGSLESNVFSGNVGLLGFDISGATGTAYAALNPFIPGSLNTRLYTIDLSTGSASLAAEIGGVLALGLSVAPGAQPIPEPATMLLLGTGLAGVGVAVRRRRKLNK